MSVPTGNLASFLGQAAVAPTVRPRAEGDDGRPVPAPAFLLLAHRGEAPPHDREEAAGGAAGQAEAVALGGDAGVVARLPGARPVPPHAQAQDSLRAAAHEDEGASTAAGAPAMRGAQVAVGAVPTASVAPHGLPVAVVRRHLVHVREVVGREGAATAFEGQAPLEEDEASCRVRVGAPPVRGATTLDAQDPAGAPDALGHLVPVLLPRPRGPSEEGVPVPNAVALAKATGQGVARLRLPRVVGGHAKAAPVVLAQGGLHAGPVPEVRVGTPVGAVGASGVEGRALGAAGAAAVRAEVAAVGPAVRVADPAASQGPAGNALVETVHPPRAAPVVAGRAAGVEAKVRRSMQEVAPSGEGARVAAVPTEAASGVAPSVLRAPVHVALRAAASDVEQAAPLAVPSAFALPL